MASIRPVSQPRLVNDWKERDYARWAKGTTRAIADSVPLAIASLIRECLSPKPEDRPTPVEFVERVCRYVGTAAGCDLKATLQIWTREANGNNRVDHPPWAAEVAGDMGGTQRDRSIRELEAIVAAEPPSAEARAAARWLCSSRLLARLLVRRGGEGDLRRAGDIALSVLRFIVQHFDRLDMRHELYSDPLDGSLVLSDMEPAEPTIGFAHQAISILTSQGRHIDPEVRRLNDELAQRWQANAPTADEFIRQLLDPDECRIPAELVRSGRDGAE